MYRPNVSMIVYRKSDGKFLLVHKPRERHSWQFPQGGVDQGEDYQVAAKRELEEELGTNKFEGFHKSDRILFYDFPADYDGHDGFTGQKQSYFFVEFLGEDQDITLDGEELDDFRWVYENELDEYLESPDYLKKVHQVIYEFGEYL